MSERLHAGRQRNPPFPHPPTQILCLLLNLLITPSSGSRGKLATLTHRELTSAPLFPLQVPDPTPNASEQRLSPKFCPGAVDGASVSRAPTRCTEFLPCRTKNCPSVFFLSAFANLTFYFSLSGKGASLGGERSATPPGRLPCLPPVWLGWRWRRHGCCLLTFTRREGHSRWLAVARTPPTPPHAFFGRNSLQPRARNSSLAGGGGGSSSPPTTITLLHHPPGQDSSRKEEVGNSR